eukprot:6488553-Amphidinium_carterae.1
MAIVIFSLSQSVVTLCGRGFMFSGLEGAPRSLRSLRICAALHVEQPLAFLPWHDPGFRDCKSSDP